MKSGLNLARQRLAVAASFFIAIVAITACGGGGDDATGGGGSTTGVVPAITSQPASASVVVPQTATFTVVATGTPAPTYQWQQSAAGGVYSNIAGATGASFTTPATTASDNGKSFKVLVSNASGSVLSGSALLTVASTAVAPAFNQDVADLSVLAPDPAVFSAHATGAPTPNYQWQRSTDGGITFSDIGGATVASYTSAPTALVDNGTFFRVVATNSAGSATSRSSKLTVYNPGIGGLVSSVARDSAGNLYASVVPDSIGILSTFRTGAFYGIRKVDISGNVTTLAGNNTKALVNGTGSGASFVYPFGLAVDSQGNVFVADSAVSTIRKITPAGVVTTFAGGNTAGGYVDGTGTQASFWNPVGIAIDGADNLYVADVSNNRIRKITPAGVVTTLAGGGPGSAAPVDGTGAAASFSGPKGVAVDVAGNVFVADTGHHAIRKVTATGVVTTLAGGQIVGFLDGTGNLAQFKFPGAVAVDGNGVLWVGDTNNSAVRKVTQAGVVTTLMTGNAPNSIAVDADANLYMDFNYGSQQSPYEIRKITPAGVTSTIPDCCTRAP
jgi:hypothetical protein